ncbi:MAG: serine protease [Burkholderiales bacterium]|nr:serine protease [Burkholderiales bacterium]
MKRGSPPFSAVAWTALLAVLAAVVLAWSPPVGAATDEGDAAASELAARSRALQRARMAMVGVQVQVVEGARSATTLGPQRSGSGVVIGADGLVLTIGYLVLEADEVQLSTDDGRTIPARAVGYDVASGLGLVQALAPLHIEPVPLGHAAGLAPREALMIASGGDDAAVSPAWLVSRRAFSGYWEYHIPGALFTSPPRRDHSGAGLFNGAGRLVGIGSLVVADANAGEDGLRLPGNMFVPVDVLPAQADEWRRLGHHAASHRAWIGVNCVEQEGVLRVVRVTTDSPADVAGLQPGDRILRIDGTEVHALESLWKALWAGGAAEREVALDILRNGQPQTVTVHSVDRVKTFKRPRGI